MKYNNYLIHFCQTAEMHCRIMFISLHIPVFVYNLDIRDKSAHTLDIPQSHVPL